MFSHAMMVYILVETPLHVGSGRGLGAVDLPIQRERVTGYPLVQASGIKGKLRAEATEKSNGQNRDKLFAVFGPDSDTMRRDPNEQYAGALSPGDARLLLLPVRSLAGVFAWITSHNLLARLRRDLMVAGLADPDWKLGEPGKGAALVASTNDVVLGGKVVLEEFAYEPQVDDGVASVAEWLAENALPTGIAYEYWRNKLRRSLVVLPEDDLRDFAQHGTEVATRIKINNDTKTVDREEGALWTEESLPTDTLLYVPLFASTPRRKVNGLNSGEDVLAFVNQLGLNRVQLGGDETVGRGLVALRYGEVKHV